MSKQTVKLNETTLRKIVAESVRQILGNQYAYNDCLKVSDLKQMMATMNDDDTIVFVDGENRCHHFVKKYNIRNSKWQEGLHNMDEEPIKALYIFMET